MRHNTPTEDAAVLFELMTLWLVKLEIYDGEAVEMFLERVRTSDFSGATKDMIYALSLKATAGELED